MARNDMRKTDRRTPVGREDLEGRNLQSALVQPPAAAAAEYQTIVLDRSHEGFVSVKLDPSFVGVKLDPSFVSVKLDPAAALGGFLAKKSV